MSPNIGLIFVCLVLGVLLRRSPRFPANAPQAFNAFVIWLSMPAVVLVHVPALIARTQLSFALLIPISMAWLLFGLSFLVFSTLGRRRGWTRAQTGALILTAGLANTAYVGLPLLDTLLGSRSIPIGLLVDQPGSFLVLSTAGIFVAAWYGSKGGERPQARALLRSIATFPPFVALFFAVVWSSAGGTMPLLATTLLERIAATLVPLALVAVGFQLRVSGDVLSRRWRPLALGLLFKLGFVPLFFIALYVLVLGSHDFVTHVTLLEAAMAPMITAAVVADEFGLDREIANLMVGVGIPLSLVTVPLWNKLPLVAGLG